MENYTSFVSNRNYCRFQNKIKKNCLGYFFFGEKSPRFNDVRLPECYFSKNGTLMDPVKCGTLECISFFFLSV